MNNYKTVPFEVIEVWYNDAYTPFTFQPISDKSKVHFAIKIADDVFLLGEKGSGLHICDKE